MNTQSSPLDQLAELARNNRRRRSVIVLPEALDARVLAAAIRADADDIATCVLLGDKTAIHAAAKSANITLPESLRIAPADDGARHAPLLMQLRAARNKPISEDQARAMLATPVAAGAMLVKSGEADGMVAGAATTSADVLRPALQIVGLQPGAAIASSAFLMCFADGIKVFADCALNISPDARQLALIARQSAATARAFGLQPTVAMLSYASGASGAGHHVDRTREATALLREQLPDVPITGPIQYDAAVSPDIAKIKMPNDAAAGAANVLIFPDLQAGNICYKAVQQAAGIVSIGPLMQGLAAPVNDLSRGATAQDIYYTITATAIQCAAGAGE